MHSQLLIRKARVLDPATGEEDQKDVLVEDEEIASVPSGHVPNRSVLDAEGLVLAPAFWDLHVHLREPGAEEAETIESGCAAAVRGGFGTIVSMPNTSPPIDTPERVHYVLRRARAVSPITVLPTACLTQKREGRVLAKFDVLFRAGSCAFTDDGRTVEDSNLFEEAARHIAALRGLIMDHAQDPAAERNGVMHEGHYSKKWGLPGIPSQAEAKIVERDIATAERTGCRIHLQHISAKESCYLIRKALQRSVPITAEATPHHLALCDRDVDPNNPNFKMNPPLRSEEDRAAILQAVCEGTISVLATDHAPHAPRTKATTFTEAPFGVIGLETAIGVTHKVLVESGQLSLLEWIRRWTTGPAAVLQREPPSLRQGSPANLVLLDLNTEWIVRSANFASRSRNTPFEGWRLKARAVATILRGNVVWLHPDYAQRLRAAR